jgi:predicted Zn-ribbon and HTH transcriptional regulator
MARVPITVMGYRCDRCGHQWVPRGGPDEEPRVCPACHSALWNQPEKKLRMTYEVFRDKIVATLRQTGAPLTWTEVRTRANLPQAFPNNQWVHRMESDVGLLRRRESSGMIHWLLKGPHT